MEVFLKNTQLFVAHKLGLRFADGSPLCSGLDFALAEGRQLIFGQSGSGKTRLAWLLAGRIEPSEGTLARKFAPTETLYLDGRFDAETSRQSVAEFLEIAAKLDALEKVRGGDATSGLFDLIGEDWTLEDDLNLQLRSVGLNKINLYCKLESLTSEDRDRVALVLIERRRPEVLILEEPSEFLRDRVLSLKLRNLIFVGHEKELIDSVQTVWLFGDNGLKKYSGGYENFHAERFAEIERARALLADAEREVERYRALDRDARERQMVRIERGKQFADTGMPRTHRGNKKRKSQESLSRIRHLHEAHIEHAETKKRALQNQIDELQAER